MTGEKVYVIGHKHPDTDTIVSATVYARKIGAVAARAGELNPETQYAFEKFPLPIPELKTEIAEDEKVVIVDTNNKDELIPIKGKIVEIIDHHKLYGNLSTPEPIKVHIEPVGSTSTIIASWFIDNLTKEEAGLLLSGILSDTVIFRSPTTTEKDKEIVKKLAEIIGMSWERVEKYGIALKEKAAQLSENPKENITRDFKKIEIGGKKFGIGQVEIFDYSKVMDKVDEYINAMKEIKEEKGFDYLLFMVTNILEKATKLLIVGENPEEVAKAFEKELIDNRYIELPGVVSRKKQIVPVLQKYFG